MNRVCPNCSKELDTVGNYFCFNCGSRLPETLTSGAVRTEKAPAEAPPFVIKSSIEKRFLMYPIASLFVLMSGIAAYKIASSVNLPVPTPKVPQIQSPTLEFGLEAPISDFALKEEDMSSLVPSDADIYIEGSDIQRFLYQFAVPAVEASPSLISRAMTNNLSQGRFALFSQGPSAERTWTFIGKPGDVGQVEDFVRAPKEASWLASVVENYLVVSNNPKAFENVRSAKKQLILNLGLTSKFATIRNSNPTKGKLFVAIMTTSAQDALKGQRGSPYFNDKFSQLVDTMALKGKNGYVIN